jgi:hypothetical protein
MLPSLVSNYLLLTLSLEIVMGQQRSPASNTKVAKGLEWRVSELGDYFRLFFFIPCHDHVAINPGRVALRQHPFIHLLSERW